MALLRDHADRVNVQRHFNLGTTILLCLAKQTSPGKKKSLCRSSGRIRPENYSCAQQGHPLFHLKEDQTKFPVPGQKQCSLLMGIHKPVFFSEQTFQEQSKRFAEHITEGTAQQSDGTPGTVTFQVSSALNVLS